MLKIMKSSEDYLEAMLMLKEQYGYIRSVDIANKLGITKASVSVAVKNLKENGYISMDKDGAIELLAPGKKIAQSIYHRHKVLMQFLELLGIDEDTAEEDACKLEHDMTDKTFKAIEKHVKEMNEKM